MSLELSAPNPISFFISVIMAVIAVVIHYVDISIPYLHSGFVILIGRISDPRRRQRPWRTVKP
jgi:hypothetical protein